MYKFSKLADEDIFHIAYTIQQFGQNQARCAPLRVQETFHLLHVAG